MIEVTQSARDAAADYLDAAGWDWGACGDVRKGRVEHPLVQAFAAAEQRGMIAARDAAVAVCREQELSFASEDYANGQPLSSMTERFACKLIAQAIATMPMPDGGE